VPRRVFISYRRNDTASAARRIYDRLSRVLPRGNVFFDVSTIGGGEEFGKEIASQIARSDVALIFIGDKWLGQEGASGKARIWEVDDHVRAEVRAALAQLPLVTPVLVAGATMPKPAELPEDIRVITGRNALLLRHESFDGDARSIVATVLGHKVSDASKVTWSRILFSIVGALLGTVLVFVAALIHFSLFGRPLSASLGAPLTALVILAAPACGAWLGWRRGAPRGTVR